MFSGWFSRITVPTRCTAAEEAAAVTPIAEEVPGVEARTAEEVTTVETAATTIVTIRGTGTVAGETAARTITGRPGTITTGTRARIRDPEVEGEDTTSGTTRTRTTVIAAPRTGSAPVRTILLREAAVEIIAPEATTITIVAATEALPADTTTVAAAPLPMTTNATAAAADPEVVAAAAEMITILRPVQLEAIASITAAAAEAGEVASGTSPATRWARPARWDRRGFHAAAEAPTPARCGIPADRGPACRRI